MMFKKLRESMIYSDKVNFWIKKIYMPYCKENNIADFKHFLYKGWNGICGESFGALSSAPEILLSNIKEFESYYNKLDIDFQQDLININTIAGNLKTVSLNKTLRKFLVKIIKNKLRATPILD